MSQYTEIAIQCLRDEAQAAVKATEAQVKAAQSQYDG